MKASSTSWKHEPFTEGRPLAFNLEFSYAELLLLKEGIIPKQMEDKWFVYYDDPYLFFHRSWTGKPVYRVALETNQNKVIVSEALWAIEFAAADNADPTYQSRLLDFLISNLLLKKNKPFPLPVEVKETTPGVFQHHTSGTGYREVLVKPENS